MLAGSDFGGSKHMSYGTENVQYRTSTNEKMSQIERKGPVQLIIGQYRFVRIVRKYVSISWLEELEKSAHATWKVVASIGGRSSSTSFPSVLVLSCCGVSCAIPRARCAGKRSAAAKDTQVRAERLRPVFGVKPLKAGARRYRYHPRGTGWHAPIFQTLCSWCSASTWCGCSACASAGSALRR